MTSALCFGGSVVAGTALGWLFAVLWRRCAPAAINRRFWASLSDIAKKLLAVDEPRELLALYRRMGVDVGGYVIRNVGGLVLGCLPVGVFLALAAPAALALWDRTADGIALYPEPATTAGTPAELPEILARLEISAAGPTDPSSAAPLRTAVCWSEPNCTIFALLAFRVIETPEPLLPDAPYLVARAQHHDVNPLWPYLSDLELVFACALMAGSVAGLVGRRSLR